MSSSHLDSLLRPRSIAVVGASLSDPYSVGARTAALLSRHSGRPVYIVHPRAETSGDPAVVPSLADLPELVDLVVVAVPAPDVVGVVREAARLGVEAALIFTSGFAEGGTEGRAAQEELRAIVAETGMLVSGPNTMGYVNAHDGLMATFFLPIDAQVPAAGPVAIASQSGALATYVDELARDRGIHPGWLVTTGNEAGVEVTDVLAYLVEQPEVRIVAGILEGLRNAEAFVEVAARAAELGKPLIVVKAGRSSAGLAAALSHTASVSGADEVFDGVCRQYGVLRAQGLEQALDWLAALQSGRPLSGNRVGLLTGSGGGGVLMADAAQAAGLSVPPTPREDAEAIEAMIPSFGSSANPVDVTGQAIASGLDTYQGILERMMTSPGFDAVVVSSGLRSGQAGEVAAKIAAVHAATDRPMIVNWYGTDPDVRRVLLERGVPTYPDVNRALDALGALHRSQIERPRVTQQPRVPPRERERLREALTGHLPDYGRRTLSEAEAKNLLAGLGIGRHALGVVTDARAAGELVMEDDTPMVVKVVSADLPHKSDVGGVRVGVRGAEAVRAAATEILESVARLAPLARVEGLLVEEMAPSGVELVCGAHRDPVFGPVVTVGLGGVLVEVIGEASHRKAPLTLEQARDAVEELADGRLVSNRRGLADEAVELVADILVRLGSFVAACPEVAEVDLNPVIVGPDGAWVADALLVLETTT